MLNNGWKRNIINVVDTKCFVFKAKIKQLLSMHSIKMSSQKIKFGDKEVDKKNSIHLKKLFY